MPSNLASLWRRYETILGPLCGLAFVWVLFAVLTMMKFHHDAEGELSWMESLKAAWINKDSFTEIVRQSTIAGIAALGATMILIAGGLDLSVGSTIALVSMVVALLLDKHVHPAVAVAGGVGAALLVGLSVGSMVIGHIGRVVAVFFGVVLALRILPGVGISGPAAWGIAAVVATGVWVANRFFVRKVELTPFIVTLGMMAIIRGVALGLIGKPQISPAKENYGFLADIMRAGPLGLPSGTWIFLGLAVAMALLLRYTAFGRHVFAIGSNEETARLCGIPVPRVKLIIYVLGIGLAGLAGTMQFAYISQGSATEAQGLELTVIAACVIGGTSLSGGEGSIIGTIIGVLILRVVTIGCSKMGWDNSVQLVVTGGIILAAVVLDRLRHRKPA